jgi:hypothetical protein
MDAHLRDDCSTNKLPTSTPAKPATVAGSQRNVSKLRETNATKIKTTKETTQATRIAAEYLNKKIMAISKLSRVRRFINAVALAERVSERLCAGHKHERRTI